MPSSRGFARPGLALNGLRRTAWPGKGATHRALARRPASFFSTITTTQRPLHTPSTINTSLSQWQRIRSPGLSLPYTSLGLRFSSTSPSETPTTAASPQANPEPAGSFEQINFNELANLESSSISTIPEHIGFLHELGVEYGWGARATIQWTLEHIHIWTGMPWWAAIVATTILFRAITFPLAMRMSNTSARMSAMGPVTKPIQEKMRKASLTGDNVVRQEAFQELAQVYKSANASPLAMILPAFVPMWIGISSFNLLRRLSTVPVPGFLNGGFLWVQDLTCADPFYVLPFASSLIIYFLLKYGGETGVQTGSPFSQKTMDRIRIAFPTLAFVAACFMPASIQLTLLVASTWGGIQATLLRNPRTREYLGLYPIIKSTPPQTQHNRVTITPADVKRGTEAITDPLKNYQAPQEQKTTILQGAQKEVRGMYSEMKRGLARATGGLAGGDPSDSAQTSGPKRSKSFTKEAKAYEQRRAGEMRDERWARGQSERRR